MNKILIILLLIPWITWGLTFPSTRFGVTDVFHLDEGAGTAFSGTLKNCKIGNHGMLWVTGKFGSALYGTGGIGNQSAAIPDNGYTQVSSTNSFSYGGWFKPYAQEDKTLLLMESRTSQEFQVMPRFSSASNGISLYIGKNGVGGASATPVIYPPSGGLDKWNFVVLTNTPLGSGSTVRIYINAISSSSVSYTVTSAPQKGPVCITGYPTDSTADTCNYNSSGQCMRGSVDEVFWIKDKILTQAEIARLYREGLGRHAVERRY